MRDQCADDYEVLFHQVVIRMVKFCVMLDYRLCGNNPRTEECWNRSVQDVMSLVSAPEFGRAMNYFTDFLQTG